ncbi:MAG: hypothetical protein ACO3NZ_08255, partial [Pirellulales bacterium]
MALAVFGWNPAAAQGPIGRLLPIPGASASPRDSAQQPRPTPPANTPSQPQQAQQGADPTASQPPPAENTATPPAPSDEEVAQQLLAEADRLRKQREVLEEDSSISVESKPRVFEQIDTAIEALERQRRLRSERSQLQRAAASVEQRKAAVAKAAAEPIDLGLQTVEPAAELDRLDTAKREAEQALATVSEEVAALTDRIATQRREAKQLPQQIADLEAKLNELQSPPVVEEGQTPVLTLAIQFAHEKVRDAAAVELEVARQKVTTYDAEAELLPLELEQIQRREAAATDVVEEIGRRASRRRQDIIVSRVEEFETVLDMTSELRQTQAKVTLELFSQWSDLAKESRRRSDELTETRARARTVQSDLEEMQALVASDLSTGGGLSRSVGYLLQRTRGTLPSLRDVSLSGDAQSQRVDDIQE